MCHMINFRRKILRTIFFTFIFISSATYANECIYELDTTNCQNVDFKAERFDCQVAGQHMGYVAANLFPINVADKIIDRATTNCERERPNSGVCLIQQSAVLVTHICVGLGRSNLN